MQVCENQSNTHIPIPKETPSIFSTPPHSLCLTLYLPCYFQTFIHIYKCLIYMSENAPSINVLHFQVFNYLSVTPDPPLVKPISVHVLGAAPIPLVTPRDGASPLPSRILPSLHEK